MSVTKPPNGRTLTILVAVIAMLVGVIGGSIAMGSFYGGLQATVEGHLKQGEIHQTKEQKEALARTIVDREVNPDIAEIKTDIRDIKSQNSRMEARLIRIEESLP